MYCLISEELNICISLDSEGESVNTLSKLINKYKLKTIEGCGYTGLFLKRFCFSDSKNKIVNITEYKFK